MATPLVTVAFNNAVTFGAYGHAMEFLPPSKYKDLLGGIYAGTMRVKSKFDFRPYLSVFLGNFHIPRGSCQNPNASHRQ